MPHKKSTKKIEKKTTEGPKKNKSSYMFFCSDERETIKNENPELSNKEILVEMGARWKILKESDPDRLKKYEELAAEDKERFLREKGETSSTEKTYKEETKETNKKVSSKEKKTKKVAIKEDDEDEESQKENTPKKTKVNGYINFCKGTRDIVKRQKPDFSPKEVTSELGKLWKELSNEEKDSWKNL